MPDPDAMFKNGAFMNVVEGEMYTGVYCYPDSDPMSSTLQLNVL